MSNNICLVIAGVDGTLVHPDLSVMAQSFLQPDSTGKVIDAITSHALDCWAYTDHDSLCAIPMTRTSRANSGQVDSEVRAHGSFGFHSTPGTRGEGSPSVQPTSSASFILGNVILSARIDKIPVD